MTNHPTGDTALSRAITTGAPVATNDKQAAELTQRFKVGDRVKWKTLDDRFGSVRRVLSGEYMTVAWDGAIDAIEHAGNLELAPTPRPTPGGEWRMEQMGQGGLDPWCVHNGVDGYFCDLEDRAMRLRTRLNAADAMERALKAIAADPTWRTSNNELWAIVTAALRGGA